MSIGVVRVPSRFEAVRDAVGPDNIGQVLIESPNDLVALKQALAEVSSSGQGKLMFLRGSPGAGKTSLAESSAIFLADIVGGILSPPADYEVSLQDLPAWLAHKLPEMRRKAGEKIMVVNLDGREIPTLNEAATNAAMVNLNALLRRNPNILLTWPVIEESFAKEAISRLQAAGAHSALVQNPIHEVQGVDPNRYVDVLNLLLRVTSLKLEDAAISNLEAEQLVNQSQNVGDYLAKIQNLVVSRYDIGDLGSQLPLVYIVFSSNLDTNSICRLLRRGSLFLVDPDRLLQFSRANVAEDWKDRGKANPRKGLAFITSLLEVRVLNISSSALVNACAFGNDQQLKEIVRQYYPNPISSNATTLVRSSSLVRALTGQEDVGNISSNPTSAVQTAYNAIQELTNQKHRQINESIIKVVQEQIGIDLGKVEFEHRPLTGRGQGLRADVWLQRSDRPEAIEFTHQSGLSEARMSSYLLYKIQDYARDYGLI